MVTNIKKKLLIGIGIAGLELVSLVPEYYFFNKYFSQKYDSKYQAEYREIFEKKNELLDKLVKLMKDQEVRIKQYEAQK